MKYLGDITPGKSIRFMFNTFTGVTRAPVNIAASPTPNLHVYKNNTSPPTFTGVSLTTGFNSTTGLHAVTISTSGNSNFYTTGADYSVVIATGTVAGTPWVGTEVGYFSISNRSPLRPTIADNTINVTGGIVASDLVSISGVGQTAWDLKSTIDAVESGYKLRDALKLILSSTCGKLSGAEGTTVYIRDINDLKNRIVANVTVSGNRTSITTDVT